MTPIYNYSQYKKLGYKDSYLDNRINDSYTTSRILGDIFEIEMSASRSFLGPTSYVRTFGMYIKNGVYLYFDTLTEALGARMLRGLPSDREFLVQDKIK